MADLIDPNQSRFTRYVGSVVVFGVGIVVVIAGFLIQDALGGLFIMGVGSSIVAAAIVAGIHTYQGGDMVHRILSNLESRPTHHGIHHVYPKRVEIVDHYRMLIDKVRARIWVQGDSLTRFIQSNYEELLRAAQRGVQIRILALDTHALIHVDMSEDAQKLSFRAHRKVEETRHKEATFGNGQAWPTPPTALETAVAKLNAAIEVESDKFRKAADRQKLSRVELRTYRTTTGNMLFVLDAEMFAGPYLHELDSGEVHTMRIGTGAVFDQYIHHFEALWQDSLLCEKLQDTDDKEEEGEDTLSKPASPQA